MPDEQATGNRKSGSLPLGDRRAMTRVVVRLTERLIVVIAAIVVAYALMPTDDSDWWWAALPMTLLGLGAFIALFVRQLRRVAVADYPVLRATEALVLSVFLFIVLFAAIAVQLDAQSPGSYSEPLTKVDGMYFSVTTLATVGYGDITPVSTTGRVVGIVQMLGNLALLGVAVRLIGQAVQRARVGSGNGSHGAGGAPNQVG